jgi:hypothetical protein
VEPLVGKLDSIPETEFWRRFWYELPSKHTESWYVRQALEGTWPDEPKYRFISLVCRPNLDMYRGVAGQYTNYYGNLRKDGTDRVLSPAMADGACSDDQIWFAHRPLPPISELAMRFGRPDSQRIHRNGNSIRRLWLDFAHRT